MSRSQIFYTAHATAKATRNSFTSYRTALSAALKAAYAPTPKVVEFENFRNERILPALEAIANGGRWNATIYGKKVRKGKETVLSVYVDGKEYCLATTYTQYAEEAKVEFMAAVRNTPRKAKAAKQDNRTIFGASSEGENDYNFLPSALYHAEMAI
jgi:hypothetical protein